jgi:hypothetical protein
MGRFVEEQAGPGQNQTLTLGDGLQPKGRTWCSGDPVSKRL